MNVSGWYIMTVDLHAYIWYDIIVYKNYIIEPESYNLMLKYGITM